MSGKNLIEAQLFLWKSLSAKRRLKLARVHYHNFATALFPKEVGVGQGEMAFSENRPKPVPPSLRHSIAVW